MEPEYRDRPSATGREILWLARGTESFCMLVDDGIHEMKQDEPDVDKYRQMPKAI